MRVLPGSEEEYRRRHAAVWPELLADLGGRRSKLFDLPARRGPVCLPRGRRFRPIYQPMAGSDANARWQAEMAGLIDPLTDPATGFQRAAPRSSTSTDRLGFPEELTMSATRAIPADPAAPQADGSAGRRPNWPSRSRRGGSSTPGRGSGSSRSRACRGTCSRRSRTRRPSPATPGSRRRSRSISRGTRSTTPPALAAFARERGIRIGGINSNTFQDEDYKLGALCHPDAARAGQGDRRRSSRAARSPRQTGSDIVKVWLADGTNYPGQDDFRARRRRLIEALARGLRRAAAERPDAARVQAVRAGLLPHGRAGLGRVADGLPAPRRTRPGVRRHRPSRDGREHRADRRDPPPGGTPRAPSTSTTRSTATTT